MVCRNKGRAEAAKDEIVDRSKNQVRNLLHVSLCVLKERDPYPVAPPEGETFFLVCIEVQKREGVICCSDCKLR